MRMIKKVVKVGTNSLMIILEKGVIMKNKIKAGDYIEVDVIGKFEYEQN